MTDCCKGPIALRNELAGSPDFWTILNRLASVPEAAGDVFQLVEDLTTSTQPGITADNYEAAIALLNEFATAAQVGAREEQLHDQATRRAKGSKAKKPESNETVVRGSKAMSIVFQLSSRVPNFIEQSHLETTEGMFILALQRSIKELTGCSMDSILVAYPQNPCSSMPESLPRDSSTGLRLSTTHTSLQRPRLS